MEKSKQTLQQRYQQLSRLKKISIISVGVFIFYTVAGFLIIPPIARVIIEKKLPQVVKRNVSVEKVRLNPFTLALSVEGFKILQKDNSEEFLSFDKLLINFQAVSLFKRALILKSVTVSNPRINFSRIDESTFSFSDLIPPPQESSQTTQSSPLSFSINNIEIINGDIKFTDTPKQEKHHVTKVNLAVASISNLPYDIEHFVQPAFSAVINGTPFSLRGNSKPFATSRETDFDINITNLNVAEYLAYLPNPTKAILASCLLDIKGNLRYSG